MGTRHRTSYRRVHFIGLGLLAALLPTYAAQVQPARAFNPDEIQDNLAALAGHQRDANCSHETLKWMWDYTDWHAQQRDQPEAKYLLYLCGNPGSWGFVHHTLQYCWGIGDRLRGMQELLRLAAYSNRVLLFHWTIPFQLEEALVPGDIDWRVKPEYKLHVSKKTPYMRWDWKSPMPPELKDGSWREMYADNRVVVIFNQFRDVDGANFKYAPHFGGLLSDERACSFKALFRPSPKVEEMVAQQEQALFGGRPRPYVAAHLRLGGLVGEPEKVLRFDQFKGAVATFACMRQLAAAHGLGDNDQLLITDNQLLRHAVATNVFPGVIGPSIPAAHIQAGKSDIEHHLTSFVDLLLLSRAKCFIYSPSGFSYTAWYMGDQECYVHIDQCISWYSKEANVTEPPPKQKPKPVQPPTAAKQKQQ